MKRHRSVGVRGRGDALALAAVAERDALLRLLSLANAGCVLMPSGWKN